MVATEAWQRRRFGNSFIHAFCLEPFSPLRDFFFSVMSEFKYPRMFINSRIWLLIELLTVLNNFFVSRKSEIVTAFKTYARHFFFCLSIYMYVSFWKLLFLFLSVWRRAARNVTVNALSAWVFQKSIHSFISHSFHSVEDFQSTPVSKQTILLSNVGKVLCRWIT